MITQDDGILELLIELAKSPKTGLKTMVACGRAISADAQFNIWMSDVAKKTLSTDQLFVALERYDGLRMTLFEKMSATGAIGESGAMEQFLRDLSKELEVMAGEQ
jgi:hypothetical protein